jgi:hypothetical protein
MKSFQPKSGDAPPDDPGSRPGPDRPAKDQPQANETYPMPRPTRQDRNAEVDFRGEKRSNATHAWTTDPDGRLYKKSPGTGAMLCFMGHTLMENRSGLVVQGDLTQADDHVDRRAALDMIHRHSPGSTRQLTLGADKGFDAAEFVADLRQACVTPYVAQRSRYSAIGGSTTRHEGYALSIRNRKRIDLRRENDPPDRFFDPPHLRLGQNHRRHGPDRLSWARAGPLPLDPGDGRQQPRPTAAAAGCMTMKDGVRAHMPDGW